MTQTLPLTIRPIADGDERFIFNSWFREYVRSDEGRQLGCYLWPRCAACDANDHQVYCKHDGDAVWRKWYSTPQYTAWMKPLMTGLLQRSRTVLAVNPDDADQIYGYCVHTYADDIPVVHYLYVKAVFRGFGVMPALLNYIDIPGNKAFAYTFKPTTELHTTGLTIVYNPALRSL